MSDLELKKKSVVRMFLLKRIFFGLIFGSSIGFVVSGAFTLLAIHPEWFIPIAIGSVTLATILKSNYQSVKTESEALLSDCLKKLENT